MFQSIVMRDIRLGRKPASNDDCATPAPWADLSPRQQRVGGTGDGLEVAQKPPPKGPEVWTAIGAQLPG
jgi:hypothetical protein